MDITANGISKHFIRGGKGKRQVTALDKTDIKIQSGIITLITGCSGSGKTTLINILSGLLRPDSGNVYADNKDIYSLDDKQLSVFRAKNIGYIPQGQSVLSSLSIRQNLELAALAANDKKDKQVYDKLLEKVGLEELSDSFPDELSGGELRRLSIARSLVNDPSVIFADEPTNDLDAKNTELVLSLLSDIARGGAAVVIVSHDSRVKSIADRIITMEKGILVS